MLETGASGSVRGGDGNIPTYSALHVGTDASATAAALPVASTTTTSFTGKLDAKAANRSPRPIVPDGLTITTRSEASGSLSSFHPSSVAREQGGKVVTKEVTNALDRQIGGRI